MHFARKRKDTTEVEWQKRFPGSGKTKKQAREYIVIVMIRTSNTLTAIY